MLLMRTLAVLALALSLAPVARADERLDKAQAKAEAQLAKGKEEQAIKTLQKAASRSSADPEAQLALAQMLARVGRLADARSAFDVAGERTAGAPAGVRSRVLAARSVFALRAGTSQEALTLARQAVEAEAGAEGLAALARALARCGNAEARAVAEQVVERAPASAEAHLARGDALLAARLGAEAEPAYRRALALAPRSVAAATGVALALAAQGKGAEATRAAQAAIEMDAHSAEAQAALGLAALAKDPIDKTSEAIAAVQQARFLEPESPVVRSALGRVFQGRRQFEQAETAYAEATRLDPSWAAPRAAALELRARRGEVEAALAELQGLPEALRTSAEVQLTLGKLLLGKGKTEQAEAALAFAVEAMPGSAEAWAAYGDASYETGSAAGAAQALQRAVELDPRNLDHLRRHGLFLLYDGRPVDALPVLLDVTGRAEGKTVEAFLTLGEVYRSREPPQVDEAVSAYQEALKLEPRNAEAALGIARSYRAGKQWARAVEAYERLATRHPRLDGEAQLGIAWCYYRSGDSYKAAFYTGLAARAGADVSALRAVLRKPVWPADELDALLQQLRSRHAGEQSRAVKGLARLGRSGVSHLLPVLQRRTTAIGVRETIVDALRRLGPDARDALPALNRLIGAGPVPADDPRQSARETSLVDAMRTAVTEIKGK